MITLAGHGKDPRLVQVELPIVPNVGDRIREDCNSPDWAHKLPHLIREGEFIEAVERYERIYWNVRLENGKLALFNPEDCEIIDRASVLVEVDSIESLPEQKDFAVSISGEAILGINEKSLPVAIATNPIQITEDRELYDLLKPICDWYSGKHLAMFAVNALGQALHHAQYGRIAEAVALLTPEVMAEVIKPKAEVKKLKEFLDNFPSIDADKLPVFEQAIATEPTKSVAALRMDEGKVSVLVEIDQPVLVESDRLKLLLERREELINSGASPKGVWLCSGKVLHREFIQVVWKSAKPHEWLGGAKSRYIGKLNSDEHKSAIAQHQAGQELRKIEREIKQLQVKS